MEQFEQSILPNGICVATEQVPHAQSIALGIWVRSGPRYEIETSEGISHFVEHMLFKGTRSRSARQINEFLYPVGGQLNAFTDREFTCFSALVLPEHIDLPMEILSDMLLNSVFAKEELEREKNVVVEEIRSIEDTPEDLVHDVCAMALWPDHPLGRPVVGRIATVESLSRATMVSYVKERYTPDNVLIAAAGALEHQRMVDLALRWLGDMSGSCPAPARSEPAARPGHVFVYRKTEQAQVCLSLPAFGQGSDDNYPLIILDTVLGGGPHSRLFDEIRENRGLAYNIGSGISSYAEGGAFSVYASTSPRTLLKVVQLIHEQVDKVARDGLTDDEIDLARQHIRASWLLANEGTSSKMGRIANSQLYFDRVVPFDEVIGKLDAVTGAEVLRVARQVLNRKMCATAVVGPIQPGSKASDRLAALAT